MVPAYPPPYGAFGFTTYGIIRDDAALGGRALHAGEQVAGASSFVLTLTTYADYIREDEPAAPKVGRGVVGAANVGELERRKSCAV